MLSFSLTRFQLTMLNLKILKVMRRIFLRLEPAQLSFLVGLDTFLVWTRMIPVAALALRMRRTSFDI